MSKLPNTPFNRWMANLFCPPIASPDSNYAVAVLLIHPNPSCGGVMSSITQSVGTFPDRDSARGWATKWALENKPGFAVADILITEIGSGTDPAK